MPQEPATYALELPEIYSAYKLYIGGTLAVQMGSPDPERYQPKTQTRIVTFEAAGSTTLLLAVSDYSHFYSGLVYPPAFGTLEAVSAARDFRLAACLFIATLGLVAAVLALYLGLSQKQQNPILFSLLCLCMCVFTSYSLLHTAFALPVFPWYALEMTAGYLLTALVIVLLNRICEMGDLPRRISAGIAFGFCGLALCYGLLSPYLTVPVMNAFSMAVFLFKALAAGHLLITAGLSLSKNRDNIGPLFYASVFYAASFVWDRFLPMYEPITGGWFSEWGSLALVLAIGYTLWRDMVASYNYSLAFSAQHRQMTRQLAMQTEYARQLSEQNEKTQKLTHDFRHHLSTVMGLAAQVKESGDAKPQDELLAYLDSVAKNTTVPANALVGSFSQNAAVDALLSYHFAIAIEQGITPKFNFELPEGVAVSDVELCTVLGNLLENAVEACGRMSEGEKKITVTTQTAGELLVLMENSYDGKVLRKGKHFLSQKTEDGRIGIGLQSAREIVERCGGSFYVYPLEQTFRVGVVLPVRGSI